MAVSITPVHNRRWLGAVFAFLVLAVTGLTSQDAKTVSAVYIGMDLITRFFIIPLSVLPSFVTGPILSLATPWGLFRHYWISVKLIINIPCTIILLIQLQPIAYLARAAASETLSRADHGLQVQTVFASGAGLLALLEATVLAIFKPRGMPPMGGVSSRNTIVLRAKEAVAILSRSNASNS